MKNLNSALFQRVGDALHLLEPQFLIYDAYLLFKIDQATCCELFSILEKKITLLPEVIGSNSKHKQLLENDKGDP